jgi:hypothetical protein
MGVFRRPDSRYYWIYNELTKQKTRTDILISDDGAPLAWALYERRRAEASAQQHQLPMGIPEAAAAHLGERLADHLMTDPAFRVALERLVRTHTRRLALERRGVSARAR